MNRSHGFPFTLLLTTLALVGCEPGPPSTTASGPSSLHEGHVLEIPGGGFVEIVQKKPESRKAPLEKELSFYFLEDATTPLSPPPSSGTLTVGARTIELKADGDALVTPRAPPIFPQGDLEGVLKVDLNDGPQSIPLRLR